ncbi:MAG TPA: hypothetical protein VHU81_08970, partial [Thermoanaerobaculia bacterium]|nr:hypothetical protein [Thermoanaerobaculia bacterium]
AVSNPRGLIPGAPQQEDAAGSAGILPAHEINRRLKAGVPILKLADQIEAASQGSEQQGSVRQIPQLLQVSSVAPPAMRTAEMSSRWRRVSREIFIR